MRVQPLAFAGVFATPAKPDPLQRVLYDCTNPTPPPGVCVAPVGTSELKGQIQQKDGDCLNNNVWLNNVRNAKASTTLEDKKDAILECIGI